MQASAGSTAASPDVVVIGGGIVGTAAAAFLADAGIRVLLVEREGLASGASGADSGVVQHPFDPVLASLYRQTVALYRELSAADVSFRLADEPAGMPFVSEAETPVRRLAGSLGGEFPELNTATRRSPSGAVRRCGSWGISTGPASARLTVDALLGRDPMIPPELDAGRFGVPGGG